MWLQTSSMNHISSKYLRWLRWALIAYCAHFFVIYLYLGIYHREWQGTASFPVALVGLVALQFVYEIIATFSYIKRSASAIYIATCITTLFALLETGIIFNPTGVYQSPYVPVVLALVFVTGALGWAWPLLETIIYFGFYLFGISGFITSKTHVNKIAGLVEISCMAILGVVGYLFWRKHYDLSENTQLVELDQSLKNQRQQSATIIQSIADGVIVFGTNNKISLINPAATKLTEWPAKDALGIDVHLVAKLSQENGKPLDGDNDILAQAMRTKQPITKTLMMTGQKNMQTIVSLVVSPIIVGSDQVAGAAAVFRDVTEERKEEQQRADFISTASHEMRTPVAAIEGYLALALNDKVCTIDSKARDYLEKAHQSTDHLGKLFQDLLTSAKAEDGRLTSHPSVVEMGDFLNQLTEDLRFAAQKKSLAMDFVVGSSDVIDASVGNTKVVRPMYYVYVDPERLREVITNLFDNAVKYTDQGKVSLGLTGDDNVVQLYVRDTGPGIPAEDVSHLFQKFYRVDNSATRTIGGTGLGLFICRKIIDLYSGRIWVESQLGNGSTFFINLPRLSTQRAQQLKASEEAQEAQAATPATATASAPAAS